MSYRVICGGSWISLARLCQSVYRGMAQHDIRYDNLGFRVIKQPPNIVRVVRGGSWLSRQAHARADYRLDAPRPDGWYDNLGFRVLKQETFK